MGIKIYKEPDLKNPVMFCGWPGIGNIGINAIDNLRAALKAQEFGEIEPWDFFDPRKVTIERGLLKDLEFPKEPGLRLLDTWYDVPLYGRVDSKQNAVFVSESNLKQITTKNDTIIVVDFVADAFEDMRKYIKKFLIQRKIKVINSPFIKMEPVKGWYSINRQFHDYMRTLYRMFLWFFHLLRTLILLIYNYQKQN